jgi:ribosomal protein S18 acetylase RimI-like enzyme
MHGTAMGSDLIIRQATIDDAESIVAIWEAIAAEKRYSAVSRPFTLEEERAYIGSLTDREAILLAAMDGCPLGFQSIARWAGYTPSFEHVAEMGTFVLPEYRGQGIGRALSEATLAFGREQGYEKLVIYVRATNQGAQAFYRKLGFSPIGVLTRQVKIDEQYDDEIVMEMFL